VTSAHLPWPSAVTAKGERRGEIERSTTNQFVMTDNNWQLVYTPSPRLSNDCHHHHLTTMTFNPVETDKNDPLRWTRDEFELPLRAESGGQGEQ
jgi:hypothetical protein